MNIKRLNAIAPLSQHVIDRPSYHFDSDRLYHIHQTAIALPAQQNYTSQR